MESVIAKIDKNKRGLRTPMCLALARNEQMRLYWLDHEHYMEADRMLAKLFLNIVKIRKKLDKLWEEGKEWNQEWIRLWQLYHKAHSIRRQLVKVLDTRIIKYKKDS